MFESSLNSCGAEWWHIGEKLSHRYTVLINDRAGYGESSMSQLNRRPQNIAKELHQLLSRLEVEEKIVLIGHS